jgi:large subunit ribosomal protein L24
VQTTLLGLGIAIIVALVAALLAPLVVDWNRFRPAFEAEASRLTGMTVRVNGAIDARILPSPRINLGNVEIGAAGGEPQLRAGASTWRSGSARCCVATCRPPRCIWSRRKSA